MGRLHRASGVLIFVVALVAAWLIWSGAAATASSLAVAGAFALWLAATVALFEWRIGNAARRSENFVRLPLAPKRVMAETRGVYAGPVTLTVLVPANDDDRDLAGTLASLAAQVPAPDRVVVVADRSSRMTAAIARLAGVELMETLGSRPGKAAAVNYALTRVTGLRDNDLVVVMGPDAHLGEGFLAGVVGRMTEDRALMAIAGVPRGQEGGGLLEQLQRNELLRQAREVERRNGRVLTISGGASVFRPRALRTVAAERGRLLPGRVGDVYDAGAHAPDNEMALALRCLGGLVMSPRDCTVAAEVLPTWRALWQQRLRSRRGVFESLGAYGLRRQLFRQWAQQVGAAYGVIALTCLVGLALLVPFATEVRWLPFWAAAAAVFATERVVTVWRGGWRARLLALALLPELGYALLLDLVYVKGILDTAFARRTPWGHGIPAARTGA